MRRLVEKKIANKLTNIGAICITGAKDIGKTTTSLLFAKTIIKLDNELENTLQKINEEPKLLTIGKSPILIDEWQLYPQSKNIVRNIIDKNQANGLYLLTGSSTPLDKNTSKRLHSGAGRFSNIKMYPLTLSELNVVDKSINFIDLFDNKTFNAKNNYDLDWYIKYMCIGGRPRLHEYSPDAAIEANIDYLDNVIDFSNKQPNIAKRTFTKIIDSLSRNLSTVIKNTTIAKDVGISIEYVANYLTYAQDINLYEPLSCWNTHIRSSSKLVKKEKIHLVDTCFAISSLMLSQAKIKNDLNTLGFLFEDFVIRDLRTYASLIDANIYYYRDSQDLEIDCIIEKRNGDWIGIEIKLGSQEGINSAINNIELIKNKLEKKVLFRNKGFYVITANKETYIKDDINILSFASIYFSF